MNGAVVRSSSVERIKVRPELKIALDQLIDDLNAQYPDTVQRRNSKSFSYSEAIEFIIIRSTKNDRTWMRKALRESIWMDELGRSKQAKNQN